MQSEDSVDPGDAALQAVLACIADRTSDADQRDKLFDHILMVPPLKDWPTASLEQLRDTCELVADLGRQLREQDEGVQSAAPTQRPPATQ